MEFSESLAACMQEEGFAYRFVKCRDCRQFYVGSRDLSISVRGGCVRLGAW